MTPDVASLLNKATESLAAVELLMNRNYHAFAASRAYYSLFYVAEACLASIGQSYSSHGTTQAAYGRESAKTGRLDPKFHRWLIDAQDIRNIDDCGVATEVTVAQAQDACSWAKE